MLVNDVKTGMPKGKVAMHAGGLYSNPHCFPTNIICPTSKLNNLSIDSVGLFRASFGQCHVMIMSHVTMTNYSWSFANYSWLLANSSWLFANYSWSLANSSWSFANSSWSFANYSWSSANYSWPYQVTSRNIYSPRSAHRKSSCISTKE